MVFRKWPRKKSDFYPILLSVKSTLAWKLLLFEFLIFWFWHENCCCNNLLFLYEKCYFFVFLRLLYFGVKIVTLWVYCLLQFFGFGAKIDSVSNSLLWHENCYFLTVLDDSILARKLLFCEFLDLLHNLGFGAKIVIVSNSLFWHENC